MDNFTADIYFKVSSNALSTFPCLQNSLQRQALMQQLPSAGFVKSPKIMLYLKHTTWRYVTQYKARGRGQ